MRLGLFCILALLAGPALAQCPDSAPITIKLQSGEKAVTQAWLESNLTGKKVAYDIGREDYNANGRYAWRSNGQTYRAGSYRFYGDGTRCIGYDRPRFDRYAVKDGTLVLININGERFPGKLRK